MGFDFKLFLEELERQGYITKEDIPWLIEKDHEPMVIGLIKTMYDELQTKDARIKELNGDVRSLTELCNKNGQRVKHLKFEIKNMEKAFLNLNKENEGLRELLIGLSKASDKILKQESDINLRRREELGLKEGEFEISGNFAKNQAYYEMANFLDRPEVKALLERGKA